MLHTLLPTNERKALRADYRVRALVVFCFTLSIAGIVGVGSLFPSFFKASLEEKSANIALDEITKSKDMSGLTATQQKVATGMQLISVLNNGSSQTRFSALVSALISAHGNVRINEIDAAYTGSSTVVENVNGVAPTRDDLISFKTRLESLVPGSKVDLPISELAKATDIPYSIRVNLNLQ